MSIIKADTPLKRIGILMMFLPVIFLLVSALFWNISKKPTSMSFSTGTEELPA